MGSLFRPKAPKPQPVVDPNDVANRKGEVRLRRMGSGGSASTILTDAVERRRQTVVGMP